MGIGMKDEYSFAGVVLPFVGLPADFVGRELDSAFDDEGLILRDVTLAIVSRR